MNEVDLPLPVSPGMALIIKTKITNPLEFRRMLLEGHRYTAVKNKVSNNLTIRMKR